MNTHQRLQLQGWRANCDIQIVIDYEACIEYLAKYASKSEPKSPALKQSLKDILQNVSSHCQSHTIIRKLMMKALGERDISAQETMHHLLSLRLYSSTYRVIPVSLDGSRRLKTKCPENDYSTNKSLLDVYAQREKFRDQLPDIMNLKFN